VGLRLSQKEPDSAVDFIFFCCYVSDVIMKQQELTFRTWGGKRKGAGRKPKGERPGVPHVARPALPRRFPVHVTLRIERGVWNLRSGRCYRVIERAFLAGRDRFGFRLNHYSVQGNHLHLIVEAEDARALARGVKGLSIRIAMGLNRLMLRRGRVFADRWHQHVLRTPTEVRRALAYVLHNYRKHAAEQGRTLSPGWRDPFSSAPGATLAPPPVAPPRTWLLHHALAPA
jgi:hypothetical protein